MTSNIRYSEHGNDYVVRRNTQRTASSFQSCMCRDVNPFIKISQDWKKTIHKTQTQTHSTCTSQILKEQKQLREGTTLNIKDKNDDAKSQDI